MFISCFLLICTSQFFPESLYVIVFAFSEQEFRMFFHFGVHYGLYFFIRLYFFNLGLS